MFKHLMAACIVLGPLATPVFAAQCGPRDAVVERLSSKYSEQLIGGGLQKTRTSESIMEVWASVETGTFTVLLTNPTGVTCIVAAGTDYFKSDATPMPQGTAS
jgi:hypothetical protein